MNISDYIKEFGDKTFNERAFNEVDSLIFAELSYLYFEKLIGLVPPEKTLSDLSVHMKELVEHTVLPRSNTKLLSNAATSARFKNVKVGWVNQSFDEEKTIQFAGVTFMLEDGTAVVAFRGTDASIVGWKEDFNMAFLSEIPAQGLAVEYLNKVAAEVTADLIVCGHSKGGNLAVYASVFCDKAVRSRIKAIYNHDGPGFNENIFYKAEYVEIKDRIFKLVPHDSLIGMLLEHTDDYKVVPCNSASIGQHNPFSWKVKDDNGFMEKPKTTITSKLADKTMYTFINDMTIDQRKAFVNGLFTVIEGCGVTFLYELRTEPLKRLNGMMKAYFALTGEEKKLMALGGMRFVKTWFKSIVSWNDEEQDS